MTVAVVVDNKWTPVGWCVRRHGPAARASSRKRVAHRVNGHFHFVWLEKMGRDFVFITEADTPANQRRRNGYDEYVVRWWRRRRGVVCQAGPQIEVTKWDPGSGRLASRWRWKAMLCFCFRLRAQQ